MLPLVTPRSPVLTRFMPRMPIMATAEYRRNTATTIVSIAPAHTQRQRMIQ